MQIFQTYHFKITININIISSHNNYQFLNCESLNLDSWGRLKKASVSPVCIIMCLFKQLELINPFPHTEQWCVLSFMWTEEWLLKFVFSFVEYGHFEQLYRYFAERGLWCHILCLDKVTWEENHFWQKLQEWPVSTPKKKLMIKLTQIKC